MYCKHCGKEIDSSADYCPHCGKSQRDLVKPVVPQLDGFFHTKTGQTFKTVSIPVLGVIMLVAAIVGLIVPPKSTWLMIACILFIVLGVGCIIQFAYDLIKKKNEL